MFEVAGCQGGRRLTSRRLLGFCAFCRRGRFPLLPVAGNERRAHPIARARFAACSLRASRSRRASPPGLQVPWIQPRYSAQRAAGKTTRPDNTAMTMPRSNPGGRSISAISAPPVTATMVTKSRKMKALRVTAAATGYLAAPATPLPAGLRGSFFRNISSIRRVTRKPPKTLTDARVPPRARPSSCRGPSRSGPRPASHRR